jgi:hypothetical protein
VLDITPNGFGRRYEEKLQDEKGKRKEEKLQDGRMDRMKRGREKKKNYRMAGWTG